MIKILPPDSWAHIGDGRQAVLVKVASRGVRGYDRSQLIKYAGHEFVEAFDHVKIAKDEAPVCLTAMGASEAYSGNRNGDAFQEMILKASHDTFVKKAKWFRNHQNKPDSPFYGLVKASLYSPSMRRVNLLVALNAEKSAADRNGGFIADKELEKLARDEDLPVSMSCLVSHDICNSCGNRAKTRQEYCLGEDEGGTCKHGGCRYNLAKVAFDGHHLCVNNPDPTFFDISLVHRPADRTAYGSTADWLLKAASAATIMGGAELAERLGVTAPIDLGFDTETSVAVKVAAILSLLTQRTIAADAPDRLAFTQGVRHEFPTQEMGQLGTRKFAESLCALAEQEIVLPLEAFAKAAGYSDREAFDAIPKVASALHRIAVDGSLANTQWKPAENASNERRLWSRKCAADYSLSESAVRSRSMRAILRQCEYPQKRSTKSASDTQAGQALAKHYATYVVHALSKIAEVTEQFELTALAALLQNSTI